MKPKFFVVRLIGFSNRIRHFSTAVPEKNWFETVERETSPSTCRFISTKTSRQRDCSEAGRTGTQHSQYVTAALGMAAGEWPSIVADENSETGLIEQRAKAKSSKYHAKRPFQPSENIFSCSSQEGVNLSFHDLSYSVKIGIRRETKQILKGVHGEFRAGELTAIMGPSGAGKSSLMNALAGYTTVGVRGSLLVNGVERDMRVFCRKSCYILQDDVLPPMLSVQEAMVVAARLKLGPNYPNIEARINKILDALGLLCCRRVLASQLSGGQRKRLAIAMELVNDPPVMFFDEPTSGLDSSTSKQCIGLLKELAQSGRTIVSVLHQPSASLFELFDHVYVVANGQCIFSGASTSLVPFFNEQNLLCPQYHNPADFVLEVASMEEYATCLPKLVAAIEDGQNCSWRKSKIEGGLPSREDGNEGIGKMSTTGLCCPHYGYAASFWVQFSTLIVRNFKMLYRHQLVSQLRVGIHIGVAILIGCIFYDIGGQAGNARDNFSLTFFSIIFNMFTSYSSAVMYYPLELPILAREHFNKWYSLKSYYLAANLSEAPLQIFCTSAYFTIVYFMTSQPLDGSRYLISAGTILLVSLLGQSLGFLIGSSMSITNAAIFGPFLICPFILFSGFFVLVTDAPWQFQWIFHISYFKYALHASMQSTYGFDRGRLPCNLDYCHFRVPSKFLQEIGMADGDFTFDWAFILIIISLLRLATYFALVVQIRFLRK